MKRKKQLNTLIFILFILALGIVVVGESGPPPPTYCDPVPEEYQDIVGDGPTGHPHFIIVWLIEEDATYYIKSTLYNHEGFTPAGGNIWEREEWQGGFDSHTIVWVKHTYLCSDVDFPNCRTYSDQLCDACMYYGKDDRPHWEIEIPPSYSQTYYCGTTYIWSTWCNNNAYSYAPHDAAPLEFKFTVEGYEP